MKQKQNKQDIEIRFAVAKGKMVGGGIEREIGVSRYKLLYVEWINNRKWQPTAVVLPGESHGWRSLGYSLWGRKEQPHRHDFTFTFLLYSTKNYI